MGVLFFFHTCPQRISENNYFNIHTYTQIRGERTLGADDLLPVLAWTVARCRLVCAELEAELMAGLLPAALLAGEGGYYLTALFSAVAVLKRLAPDAGPESLPVSRLVC